VVAEDRDRDYGGGVSSLAHAFWPRWYRLLLGLDPIIGAVWRRFGLGITVRVVVLGRRTGQPRPVYLGLLRVCDRLYLVHPDVSCAWTANLEAAGRGEIQFRDGRAEPFEATLLQPGRERDAAIRATFRQQPFPGNVLYWLSRGHLHAVGRFYRLERGAT
jgi:deazaflavin-dependent oxidoreductase (nitroreductase family)